MKHPAVGFAGRTLCLAALCLLPFALFAACWTALAEEAEPRLNGLAARAAASEPEPALERPQPPGQCANLSGPACTGAPGAQGPGRCAAWLWPGGGTCLAHCESSGLECLRALDPAAREVNCSEAAVVPSASPRIADEGCVHQAEEQVCICREPDATQDYALLKQNVAATIYGRVRELTRAAAQVPRRPRELEAPRVLVGVVADSSRATCERARRNILAVSKMPPGAAAWSFAYVVYDDQVSLWQPVVAYARTLRVDVTVMPGRIRDIHKGFMGKMVFQAQLLPLLPAFDVVWLLDADIILEHFDAQRFFRAWRHAFVGGPPLIAQPVSRQSTQGYATVNLKFWESGGVLEGLQATAAEGNFVEIQMPLIDAGFLVWFMDVLAGRPWLKYILSGSDWGINRIWCKMAASYARETLQAPRLPSCAIVVEAVDHDNAKSIRKNARFISRGSAYTGWLRTVFRPYFVEKWQTWPDLRNLSWCRREAGDGNFTSCTPVQRVDCRKLQHQSEFMNACQGQRLGPEPGREA